MKATLCIPLSAALLVAALAARGESCPLGGSPAVADGAYTLSEEQAAGHMLMHAMPKYPGMAKAAHVQGFVLINAVIKADGTMSDLVPVCGERDLMKAALKAVKKWTYQPFELDGKAVPVHTTVRVNFALGAQKN